MVMVCTLTNNYDDHLFLLLMIAYVHEFMKGLKNGDILILSFPFCLLLGILLWKETSLPLPFGYSQLQFTQERWINTCFFLIVFKRFFRIFQWSSVRHFLKYHMNECISILLHLLSLLIQCTILCQWTLFEWVPEFFWYNP